MVVSLTADEWEELAQAKKLLENPGLTARLANVIGRPMEQAMKALPSGWQRVVEKSAKAALDKALQVAISSLKGKAGDPASERWHKVMVGASGGIGGVFGLASLPVELPVSTTLMLRSIAEIARSEGHSLSDPEIQLSCLEVFALGGPGAGDDASESVYWAARAAVGKAVTDAAAYLGRKGVVDHSAPALVRFVSAVASRFGVVVSEEIAAKAVPVLGAAGGATVNVLFMDHFQAMARGHFVVKRLEARHGRERVRAAYLSVTTVAETPARRALPPGSGRKGGA
jgi:hypothetical protein